MIIVDKSPNIQLTTIRIDDNSLAAFKELVQRGVNLWPDATAEIKHFADVVIEGKAHQDYFGNPHLAGKYGKALTVKL